MKDPFSSDKARFLVLGSRCSVCGRLVCVGPVGTPGNFVGFFFFFFFCPADLGTS